jgi:hypothetical protein
MTFDSSGIRIMSNDTIIHDESTRLSATIELLPDNKTRRQGRIAAASLSHAQSVPPILLSR